jgi:hypothetical protein
VSFAATFIHDDCVWVAERLENGWAALYRFEAQDGYPALGELRVVVAPDPVLGPQAWQRLVRDGSSESVPAGGLTSRGLRHLHLGKAQEQARWFVDQFGPGLKWTRNADAPRGAGLAGGTYDDLGYQPEAVSEPRRPGRRGRDDFYYAEFAELYVDALASGSSRPVADVADKLSRNGQTYTAAYVRDVIHQARRRELLTTAPPGRPGGHLTEKARGVLQEHRGDAP